MKWKKRKKADGDGYLCDLAHDGRELCLATRATDLNWTLMLRHSGFYAFDIGRISSLTSLSGGTVSQINRQGLLQRAEECWRLWLYAEMKHTIDPPKVLAATLRDQ